jgi:hypothetical protein
MPPTGAGTKSIPCPWATDRSRHEHKPNNLDSLIAPLIANLGNAAMLTEIAVLASIAVATWFGVGLLRRRLADVQGLHGHLTGSDWHRLILPAALLPSVLIGRAILGKWQACISSTWPCPCCCPSSPSRAASSCCAAS